MFYISDVEDIVGIPPKMFGSDLDSTLRDVINEDKIGRIDKDIGVILGVVRINKTGEAKVMMGDPSAYVDVQYSLLSFKPELQSVYEGQVKEVAEFGAFVGVGPFDALIHVSQLMDDFVSFDPNSLQFSGKETGYTIAKGDILLSKLVTISYKGNTVQTKLGMTMRQAGLGKQDWWSVKKSAEDGEKEEKKQPGKKDTKKETKKESKKEEKKKDV